LIRNRREAKPAVSLPASQNPTPVVTWRSDTLAGLIGLAVSLTLFVQSFTLPKLALTPVGPGFYPRIVLVFMALVSGALVVQGLIAGFRASRRRAKARQAQPLRAFGLVALAFATTAAYVALLPLFGFRIATAMFVAAFQFTVERPRSARDWIKLLAVALGTSLITYLVFQRYLLVLLPRGSWTGW
jgi:putative tricarboxylic transport membrane protein